MRFSDFYPGQVITLGPVALTEEQIVAFARQYDPQWFHTDRERAAASRWGGLIASGWQTCAVAMRLACDHVLAGSESIGSPGLAYLKWPAPVRPGEPLTLNIEVLEVRRSTSRPDLGVVRWRWNLRHADGRVALDLEATSLFDLSAVR
ncbi:MAG: MaoC family dehydratase [Sutterellaceae bacterium]|nr:MaoC family dehydratase [Burkholderiaceae bacterium]MDW8429886.1 MaoC family dehydratase [Sutterellaceae bacterium]